MSDFEIYLISVLLFGLLPSDSVELVVRRFQRARLTAAVSLSSAHRSSHEGGLEDHRVNAVRTEERGVDVCTRPLDVVPASVAEVNERSVWLLDLSDQLKDDDLSPRHSSW